MDHSKFFCYCNDGHDVIGLGIDYNGSPSVASWSNIGGWDPWSDVAAYVDGLEDGEFGIQQDPSLAELLRF